MEITFGKLLREARLAAGLTQEQLADKIEHLCTNVYISLVENSCKPGNRPIRPDVAIVDALANVLEIPLKVARDSANYATPEVIGNDFDGFQVSAKLFSDYSRLETPYREQATAMCEAVVEKFLQIQLGYVKKGVPSSAKPVRNDVKRVPMVFAETEKNTVAEESRRNRPETIFAVTKED